MGSLQSLSVAVLVDVQNTLFNSAIRRWGSEEQQQTFLTRTAAERAEYHYTLGGLVFDEDPQRAEVHFLKAVELDPAHAEARWLLGESLLRQGRRGEGLDALAETILVSPFHPGARLSLAR